MKILGERIIQYLKSDSALTTLLGSNENIFAMGLQEGDRRKDKFVVVSIGVGESGNYIPTQSGEQVVEVAVNRKVVNGLTLCANIASAVDDILNEKENLISNSSWKLKHFVRKDSPSNGIMIDERANEYYFTLAYDYILDESI